MSSSRDRKAIKFRKISLQADADYHHAMDKLHADFKNERTRLQQVRDDTINNAYAEIFGDPRKGKEL